MKLTTVDLATRPEYWAALGPLPEAIAALIVHDDETPYRAWWLRLVGPARAHGIAERMRWMRHLIADIREHGYRPDAWREDPRRLALEHGTGPILVTMPGGRCYPRDGAHRASILRALGLPAIAIVWRCR